MEFAKKSWAQVQVYLQQMSPSQKWLILSLVVVLLLVGFIVAQYAGRPQWVPLSKFTGDRQTEAVSLLQNRNISVRTEGTQLFVPFDRQLDALAILQQAQMLTDNTSEAFDEMLARSSPWDPTSKTRQAFVLAKQRVLGGVIGKMAGVRSADVLISMPEDVGFGKTFVRPTASVSVIMQGSNRVNRSLVEAVAGLVAGSVAEMTPQDVVVIDANVGRQFTVKSEDDLPPDTTLELVHRLEQYHSNKIREVLGYIPNVIVAVNVQTDAIAHRQERAFRYMDNEPLQSTRTEERDRRDIAHAGEPGSRPNLGMDIDGGQGAGRTETELIEETRFGDKPLTLQSDTRYVGRQTRQINVTVNVPRSFFVRLWTQGQAADALPPTDDQLEAVRESHLAQIVAQVEPLIAATEVGVVRAHMIPDESVLGPMTAGLAPATGLEAMLQSPWTPPVGVGALALVAITLMLLMVRRATREQPMPSVEELAGVPPKLPTEEELVGEAEETDTSLAGVELDEHELRYRKIAEQISEMVKANPAEAGALIGKWVHRED